VILKNRWILTNTFVGGYILSKVIVGINVDIVYNLNYLYCFYIAYIII
jgi:hypothetical protein